MKIGQLSDMSVGVTPPGSQKPEQGAKPTPVQQATQAPASGVPVTFSKLARTLGEQPVQAADPDVDMERVNAVRAAIDNGTYKVNPQAIADKMLTNAQEMLDRAARR
jgi:negative regulator of flagellin synthesis FlgM